MPTHRALVDFSSTAGRKVELKVSVKGGAMFVGMGKLLNEVTLEGEMKQSVEVLEAENTNTSCDEKDATVSSAASCENKAAAVSAAASLSQDAVKVSASSSPITCDAKEAAAAATSDSTVSTASRLIYVFILHIRKCQNSSIDCDNTIYQRPDFNDRPNLFRAGTVFYLHGCTNIFQRWKD